MNLGPSICTGEDRFYDTNFFLHHEDKLPNGTKDSSVTYWITETTEAELIAKFGETEARNKLGQRFDILRFDDLYEKNPGICPTYYFFMMCMYRPANLASDDFMQDLLNSKLARGVELTRKEQKLRDEIHKRSISAILDATSESEATTLRKMVEINSRALRKARSAAKDLHPAYLNDIRTLSLIIYNALMFKKDAVFHTADGDPCALLLKWLESVCTRLTFLTQLAKLAELDPNINRNIARGQVINLAIQFQQFVELKAAIFRGMLTECAHDPGVRISVRRWNQAENGYDDHMHLKFSQDIASWLASIHGQFFCPFTPNTQFHNWVMLSYEWPPSESNCEDVKVSFTSKKLNYAPPRAPADVHRKICRYCRVDASGELATWSDFSLTELT